MTRNLNNSQDEEDVLTSIDEKILKASLRAALHRQDCPETIELGKYQLGLLTASEEARLTTHLTRCAYCQAELNRLAEFLTEETPVSVQVSSQESPKWMQGPGFEWHHMKETGKIIIRMVKETLDTALINFQQGSQLPSYRSAYGRSRGKQSIVQLALKEGAEDFEAVITVDASQSDPTQCTIIVDVNIPSRGGFPNLRGTEVILKQNNLSIATQTTNAYGKAVFEEIMTDILTQLTFEITPQPWHH